MGLGACTDRDSVLFVTGTQIGIDADSRPPNVSIGYDRDETIIGPNYESETGAIPSVVGRLESDLAVFNPSIRQVYATGNAARLVTLARPEQGGPSRIRPAAEEDKRLMFFRTGTNTGFKVTFAEEVLPESFSFGYKRKELSFIPLIEVIDENEHRREIYGSVLVSIGTNVRTPSLPETTLGISQFFATGIAAEQLARTNPEIRNAFQTIAAQEAAAAVGATFDSSDPTVACMQGWLNSDPNNPLELQTWWKDVRKLEGLAPLLILGQEYREERRAFIDEQNISCNS